MQTSAWRISRLGRMQRRLLIEILIIFQVMTFWGWVQADTLLEKVDGESQKAPITITAKKVDFNNQKREATYSGEVKVIKGDMILKADMLKVFFRDLDQGVKRIQAHGQVKVWWHDRYAEAEEGIYDEQEQRIVLTGSPKSWQDENMLKGDKITYDLGEDKVVVEGGVETIIQIDKGSTREAEP